MQIEVWCTTFHRRLDGGQTSDRDSQVWLWEAAGRECGATVLRPVQLPRSGERPLCTARAIEKAKTAITNRSGRICLAIADSAIS
jgi:hypothetical protein